MKLSFPILLFAVVLCTISASAALAQEPCPCQLPDVGTGTVEMPPACTEGYQGLLLIDDGIPGGSINLHSEWGMFFNVVEVPGGGLGGTQSQFDGIIVMAMTGQGTLAGYNRLVQMQVSCVVDWAPRIPNNAFQAFSATVVSMTGQVLGDPDFNSINFISGAVFTLTSPGQTSLTRQGPMGDPFEVASFFDLDYEISFVGAPGSILEGLSGTTRDQAELRLCPPRDPTGVGQGMATAFHLGANYPNPFNPDTRIQFSLPAGGSVELDVFDGRGRLVRRLIPGHHHSAGTHTALWDGRNDGGESVASGVYFYRLRAGGRLATRRMVLLK